ncbi:MAG: tail fiber domain-containing protein [Psychroserpens sp.]|uniref:tail fiber domain-containing protein n=1 Tax=Psychroserpens sp. TaxID=2020870 RepID=UPI003CAC66F2
MTISEKNKTYQKLLKMMLSKTYLTVLSLFIFALSFSQNGINYKALIKDTNGNVIANDLIQIQFSILQGATSVYEETHSPTTDSNGLVILNIGEGTAINGVFADIDWGSEAHFLNVKINTGSGLIDIGTTAFKTVPYAIETINNEGLEAIDEGNGIGWRLAGADLDSHGNIGLYAVDLTNNNSVVGNFGATGQSSFASGLRTTASGGASVAFGVETWASANNSVAFGQSTTASAFSSTSMGQSTIASGQNSIAMGFNTRANSYASTAIGRYNVGGGNPSEWIADNPLFEIGNGTSNSNRSNALTVTKQGTHLIESSGSGILVDAVATGIFILSPNDGIIVSSAANIGALFGGVNAGVYAESSNSNNPDVILGGNSNSENGDNGVLASDPTYSSSDIFLRSNDAVVIALDNDNNEDGQFIIRNGGNNTVFEVDESGNISHDGSIISSSDRRLKKNVSNLDYGLKEILQMQPKQYFWRNQEQTKKSFGLIAQDVQPIINEIVNVRDDEMQTLGISYTELIPVLINAIKEQQKIIENEKSINLQQSMQLDSVLSRIEILDSKTSN